MESNLGAFLRQRFWLSSLTWFLIVGILALNVGDTVLTLLVTDHVTHEVNPFMAALLRRGPSTFIMGKMGLISFGMACAPLSCTRWPRATQFSLVGVYSLYLAVNVYTFTMLMGV